MTRPVRPVCPSAVRPAVARLRLMVPALMVAMLVAACGNAVSTKSPGVASTASSTSNGTPEAVHLTIFAASSLTDALAAAKTAYEAATPGVTLTLSFGASSALRAQLEQLAPADLFLSADTDSAQALVDGGLTQGPVQPFAGNVLALVVPKANPGKILKAADLAKKGLRIIAAGKDVPITTYANELIDSLGKLKGYPAGYAAAVEKNVVSREDNVRAVLTKIELGEGDAAFVYATDALAAGDAVHSLVLPEDVNLPTTLAAVVMRDTQNPDAAAEFLTWLSGSDGQAILAQFGFIAPPQ